MQSLTLNFQNQQIFENVLWLLKHFEEDGIEIVVHEDITEELEKAFDNGEDISKFVDWSAARRPNLE
ncbi:MAG: hypothetical protein A2023_01110 [Sulfuricurvum sp. GWF2_44_89]|uniref:Uncharacterized protein n=1 Tax=Sulfuricurvum kujiense TaxID=148813 RepID=A0A2D3WG39_9BACT|nr:MULTISPECIES: hypothetical protein [Sulfuricurvum]OHD78340.1 MAG: hypothetical protein A2023_01110 [Sulfuricurvum sp. GWF2_44_89]OHD95191.1 MAG: hypothetical protein A2517_10250 [Sulfuricurvum sp. RIFOXYD12_FULL_44_77]OHD98360.1 MAG: hypothetical protein A2552_11825 [Sulfuricurvum sp. RIFOXYD2_FULL_44_160]DAB38040.1 MAG TPA: hypothetical protein CFH83_08025 [Sulfuricurvum kujiense]